MISRTPRPRRTAKLLLHPIEAGNAAERGSRKNTLYI
jgi:hypothetical protein